MAIAKHWTGTITRQDDFGEPIVNEFVDGKTKFGPWATMSLTSWTRHGVGKFGLGCAAMYRRQSDGRWLKIAG